MSNQVQISERTLNDTDIKTLEQAGVIPVGTPAAQITVFARVCSEKNLSPFSKQIHLTKYSTKEGPRYSIITGIDGYRSLASRTGLHAGTEDAKFDLHSDGSFKTAGFLKSSGKMPHSATVTVYKVIAGQRCAFTHTALFAEFSSGQQKWNTMPFQMIAKVAEAFALRKAFPDELAGVSVEEEMGAFEGNTIQGAKEGVGTVAVDPEVLKRSIKDCKTVRDLEILYKSNVMGHAEYNELFTDRKYEIDPSLMHQS